MIRKKSYFLRQLRFLDIQTSPLSVISEVTSEIISSLGFRKDFFVFGNNIKDRKKFFNSLFRIINNSMSRVVTFSS
jgi:hypothetical protein